MSNRNIHTVPEFGSKKNTKEFKPYFVVLTFLLSRGVYGHFEISPRDSCIIAQLAFASFYRSQSREMGTMLGEYLESVTN